MLEVFLIFGAAGLVYDVKTGRSNNPGYWGRAALAALVAGVALHAAKGRG